MLAKDELLDDWSLNYWLFKHSVLQVPNQAIVKLHLQGKTLTPILSYRIIYTDLFVLQKSTRLVCNIQELESIPQENWFHGNI